MSAFVIAEIEVTDPDLYEEYRKAAASTVAAHGGRYIVRGGAAECLEGGWIPRRIVVLEFASLEKAKAWWASADYASAKGKRQRSARTRMIAVEGAGA